MDHAKIQSGIYMFIRILGFFPYKWWIELIEDKETGNHIPTLKLQKSYGWRIWSYFALIFVITTMILDIYYAVADPRGRILGFKTMVIAHMVFDIVCAITTILLQITLWWKSDMIADFLKFSESTNINVQWTSLLTSVYFVAYMIVNITSGTLMLPVLIPETTVISTIVLSIKNLWVNILMFFIGAQYYESMLFLSNQFKDIFEPLEKKCHNILNGPRSESSSPEKSATAPDNPPITNKISTLSLSQSVDNTPECISLDTDIGCMQLRVIHLFRMKKLSKAYSDYPLALTMTNLVVYLVMSAFYISLWNSLPWRLQVISLACFLTSVCTISFTLNSTHFYEEAVRYILVAICLS